MCVNGEMVSWATHLRISADSKALHIVLFPGSSTSDGILEFRTDSGEDAELTIGFDSCVQAITLRACGLVEVYFTPRYRQHSSFMSKSLHLALKHLGRQGKEESALRPRIGAIGQDELTQLIAKEIGLQRSSCLGSCWLSGATEISIFPSKAEDERFCVARKGPSGIQNIWREEKSLSREDCLPRRNLCISDLVKLASCDGLLWRRSAASFSTMMRYFQKSKSDFCWASNEDSKTIIRIAEL